MTRTMAQMNGWRFNSIYAPGVPDPSNSSADEVSVDVSDEVLGMVLGWGLIETMHCHPRACWRWVDSPDSFTVFHRDPERWVRFEQGFLER
jgi:hypothetical protein